MKLATFATDQEAHVGIAVLEESLLFDLTAAAAQELGPRAARFKSMLALIDAGDAALDEARELCRRFSGRQEFVRDLRSARLLAPLPEPRQMRDAMSFARHIVQGGSGQGLELARARERADDEEVRRILARPLGELPEIYKQIPIHYITNRFSVGGPDSAVRWPKYSSIIDYEMEFGIITKGTSLDITAAEAREHIFGFTIFNDFSARDKQKMEMQGRLGPTKGKSFNGGNVLGPWIVTPDEIEDPYSLAATVRINGRTVSESNTRGMLFSFEEILSYISQDETIMPGEFIGSGTLGDGCGLENGYFLHDGDVIEIEFDGIGILRNTIRAS